MPEIKRADESRVDKPWGYEIRWAVTGRYLGKILHVNKGEALSLQYHERKDEWLLVSEGAVDIELGGLDGSLEKLRMRKGDSVAILLRLCHIVDANRLRPRPKSSHLKGVSPASTPATCPALSKLLNRSQN